MNILKFHEIDVSQVPALLAKVRRPINKVFWHCSASDNPMHNNAETIDKWHKERGWPEIGYHAFVQRNGVIQMGLDWNVVPIAQAGHNKGSLAFCLHGLREEMFSEQQKQTMVELSNAVDRSLKNVTFHGHNEVAAKACPVIDYKRILNLDSKGKLNAGTYEVQTLRQNVISYYEQGTVRIFDRGYQVVDLQSALNKKGYNLIVDGVFGRRTEDAVLHFQKLNGLTQDGVVGPQTWSKLNG
jgi:murein L,D-transpeptidase YcbB/YkuD